MSLKPRTDDGHSKSTFTFDFSIKNVNTIMERKVSPKYSVNNISWKLSVRKTSQNKLAVILYSSPCSENSVLWSCFAYVRFTLLSSKTPLLEFGSFFREFKHLFTSDQNHYGYDSFMDWSSVIDPLKGYMKNNAITFRVHIKADFPKNLISDSDIEMPHSSVGWLRLFENTLNDGIVLRIADEFKKLDVTMEEVRSSVSSLKIDFKKTVDPIIDSVRSEITLLEKKLENIHPDLKVLITPIHDKIISLDTKIEESYRNYATVIDNFQRSMSKEIDNQMKSISSELVKMNKMIETGMINEEVLEKVVDAAIRPISTETQATAKILENFRSNHSSETQALETKLDKLSTDLGSMQTFMEKMEKSLLENSTKVVDHLENVNFNTNDASGKDLSNKEAIPEFEHDSNGGEMKTKEVNVVNKKSVPLSALNILKEILIEQQQKMVFNHISNSLISGPDGKGNVLYSYQPMMRESEFRLYDDVFHPSFYGNGFGSPTNSSFLQSEDLASGRCVSDNLEVERGNFSPSYDTVEQRLRRNEKRKSEEVVENDCSDMIGFSRMKMWRPNVLQEKLTDSSNEELMFLGKKDDGDWKIHMVSHPQQLEDLKKKYRNYKISRIDDF